MRHRKTASKLNRTSSHRRCLMATMLKDLISKEQMVTTLAKAKVLKKYADKMITLAKKPTLDSQRRAMAKLMIRFNALTSKEARQAKNGDTSSYNNDRKVIHKLYQQLGPRFKDRNGGYTRLVKLGKTRIGDNAKLCLVEYLAD